MDWGISSEKSSNLSQLIEEIKAGNVIAFVGAGFSIPGGLPTWQGLLRGALKLSKNINKDEVFEVERLIRLNSGESLDQAAQIIEDLEGSEFLQQSVKQLLQTPSELPEKMNERLKIFQEIPFKAILTTNFDTIIPGSLSNFHPDASYARRIILREKAHDFESQLSSFLENNYKNKVPVLQLHGSIGDASGKGVVCTRRGYRDLIHKTDSSYLHFLRSVMSFHTILYMGFSFNDFYLNDLRSSVLSMLDIHHCSSSTSKVSERKPIAYAITEGKTLYEQEFYLRHEGTKFINYSVKQIERDNQNYDYDHSGFDEILRHIRNESSPIYRFGRSLQRKRLIFNFDSSDYGHMNPAIQNVYKFMAFCTFQVAHDNGFEVVKVTSWEETLDKLKEEGKICDLIMTQYGATSCTLGQALSILHGIKSLQVEEINKIQISSTKLVDWTHEEAKRQKTDQFASSSRFSSWPAVLVVGEISEAKLRKKQVTAHGAVDYVPLLRTWGYDDVERKQLCFSKNTARIISYLFRVLENSGIISNSKGRFCASTRYALDDEVEFNGKRYVCIEEQLDGKNPAESFIWSEI